MAMDEMLELKEIASQADIIRLEVRIEINKYELLKWMISVMVAQRALVTAISAFLK